MSPRLAALCLLALAPLAACTWEGRPDGENPLHTASDGYFDDGNEVTDTPLGGAPNTLPDAAEVVEPLDTEVTPPASGGAVTLPPTTGSSDNVSETAEALTPGGDQ